MDKSQLKAMLVDLNEGEDITDDEVDIVFAAADISKTGVINKTEIRKAVNEWYAHAVHVQVQKQVKKKGFKLPRPEPGARYYICTIL